MPVFAMTALISANRAQVFFAIEQPWQVLKDGISFPFCCHASQKRGHD
jgi:hypothetical protein